MKRVNPQENWCESWQLSYQYDCLEIYDDLSHRGYAYAYQNRKQHTIETVCRVTPPNGRLLDLAAAQGNFSLTLAEKGYQVTWNDLRGELVDYVQLKYEAGKIEYLVGNAFDIEFKDKFDTVLITEVIEHTAHPDEFLAKVASLVKPGGYVIMTTPNGQYFRNPLPKFSDCPDPSQFEVMQFKPNADGHIFLLYAEEVQMLSQNSGLRLEEILFFNNFLSNGHIKTEGILKILPRKLISSLEKWTTHSDGFLPQRLNTHLLAVFQKTL